MRWLLSFPLLIKELTEQSARKRTYVLRFVYATFLLLAFALVYQQSARFMSDQSLGMIGKGGDLFEALFYCQYWAILLLMPALAAGSLTSEKEQGSLTILLLTDLGPWELVLQKWLSRLVTVGSFLLLSMPLMGLCYAFGGLEAERLVLGIYILLLTCMQTAAVAIALSAWCRGSIAALLGTYSFLLVMYAGPALWNFISEGGNWSGTNQLEPFWPGNLLFSGKNAFFMALESSIPIQLSIVFALSFARWALPRRAQITGSGLFLSLFRRLDALFERGDAKLGRPRRHRDLPDHNPVAWRELHRRTLANWRYMIRFLVPLIGLLVCILSLVTFYGSLQSVNSFLHIGSMALLLFALLIVLAIGSTAISTERSQQTLDVLLTTPMTARSILTQKLRGLQRISRTLTFIGLLMVLCAPHSLISGYNRSNWVAAIAYFVILPPLFTWFAVAIGLLIHNRNRALIFSVTGGCLWLGIIMGLVYLFDKIFHVSQGSPLAILVYLTPGFLPILNVLRGEFNHMFGGAPLVITVFILWHGGLWYFLRWWCLRHADRLMRRGASS